MANLSWENAVVAFQQLLEEPTFGHPLSKMTISSYLATIRQFTDFCQKLDKKQVENLDATICRKFIQYHSSGSRASKSTMVVRISALKRFFAMLGETGVVSNNPMEEIALRVAKEQREGGRKGKDDVPPVLRWSDQDALLSIIDQFDTIAAVRDSAMIGCVLDSGLREHELLAMTLADAQDYLGGLLRVVGKGQVERVIRFQPQYGDRMRVWFAKRAEVAGAGVAPVEPVWLSDTGTKMQAGHFSKQVRRWLGRAGIHAGVEVGQGGSHLIRHTACSRMLARGVDIVRVQNNLGHAHLRTTERYAHLLE